MTILIRLGSLSAALSAMAVAACLPVTSPRITAGDLALAEAQFRALPASQIIGFAPEPGTKRTFAVAELERLARRYSLPAEGLVEICMEVPQRQFSETEIVAAMRSELPAKAELKIIEGPTGLQPIGKLVFPRTGLEPPTPDGRQIWRGHIQFAETKKVMISARVQVTRKIDAVVARKDLPANAVIASDSITLESRSIPLTRTEPAARLDEVVGKMAKQSIKAGALISTSFLDEPAAVKRGDSVKVEVQSGTTRLIFEAVAERQGRDGELIELRNPSSGKLFRARLVGARAVIRL